MKRLKWARTNFSFHILIFQTLWRSTSQNLSQATVCRSSKYWHNGCIDFALFFFYLMRFIWNAKHGAFDFDLIDIDERFFVTYDEKKSHPQAIRRFSHHVVLMTQKLSFAFSFRNSELMIEFDRSRDKLWMEIFQMVWKCRRIDHFDNDRGDGF